MSMSVYIKPTHSPYPMSLYKIQAPWLQRQRGPEQHQVLAVGKAAPPYSPCSLRGS